MTDHERMQIDARTFYSEWERRGQVFNIFRFRMCLNYFESKASVHQSGEFTNLHSKMKLLFSLSDQRPMPCSE